MWWVFCREGKECGNGVQKVGMRAMDAEELREHGHRMVDFISDYYKEIESYPVRSQVQPGYLRNLIPDSAPDMPESFESILEDIRHKIIPGVTHWQSPKYFAYYPSNSSTAGFLGEMLSAGFNIVGFSWVTSPAATELEVIVLDWLAKVLKLPEQFLSTGKGGGVIQGTASEAMLVALLAARDKALRRVGQNLLENLVVYGSDQTHSALIKACKIAGINPMNCRLLQATFMTNYALSPEVASESISNDIAAGLLPIFLCATVGTTSSTAVDPLAALGRLAKANDMWFHIDAAYAGSACICPEYRHYIDGVEEADSFNMNPHKWLLTNFDCSTLWVKLWMVLRMYGVANLQNHIRTHINLAKHFEELIATDTRFEIIVPRVFALVCFALKPMPNGQDDASKLNLKLLEAVNNSGAMFLTHTVLSGRFVLRFVVGAPLTEERHVNTAWKVLQDHANLILGTV
ncbi:hypothetical protein AMTRI_Chr07g25730 [Amborella trichopoda]